MKNKTSQQVEPSVTELLRLFHSQKKGASQGQNIQSQSKPQPMDQQKVEKQQSQDDGIDMQSQSALQAEQLFGNLAPDSPMQEQKPKILVPKPKQTQKSSTKPKAVVQQQKQQILQTKSILKKGKITEEKAPQKDQSQVDQIEQEIPEKPPVKVEEKTVRFAGLLPLTIEIERKWDAPIEGQKKGKFDKQEEKILSEAVGKFLVANDISIQEFENLLTVGQRSEKFSKKQKIFSLLSTVLPKRSPQSCYKYLKRNFNTLNRKGKWSEEQIDKLKILVEKYGRKWTIISKELKRSADNCYDKFRELGQQNMDERIKGIWKIRELLDMLKLIEKMTKSKFLDSKVDKQLEKQQLHDQIQKQEVVSRKYNSKHFIFHNIAVIKPYINGRNFQKIKISEIRWNQIATFLKTRNILDCRNKTVQLLQIFFNSESKELDEQIVDFLILNRYRSQQQINWKDWKNKNITVDQAKNRYMIMKKMVQGRSVKPFKDIVIQLKERLEKKKRTATSEKKNKKVTIIAQEMNEQ